MPHAVLDKQVDLQEYQKKFEPIIKKNDRLIKIENIFVEKHNRNALLSTVVIDEEKQNFFIELLSNAEKTTVRLFPGTDPIKTKGVKKALGSVTQNLLDLYPDSKITKTNIEEFIESD